MVGREDALYTFSERLAWTAGVLLPIAETLRRWGTWWEYPPAYLDDVLIGVCFLAGAWMSRRDRTAGQRWLAAAYGVACGIGFMSLSVGVMQIDEPDISGASGRAAVLVKAAMMTVGVLGLAGALRGPRCAPDVSAARVGHSSV